jgi:hypothetical protein
VKLKEWWRSLDSKEHKLLIFIIVALLGYAIFWVLYFLGLLRYLDQPER